MKRFKKFIFGFVIVIIIAFIAALLMVRHISRRSLPDYNHNISLTNLSQTVEVFRDAFGMPHIYAQNEADLYRAMGYVSAQDRLWQMDLIRRATMGRLSEIFGKQLIDTDLLMRSLQISQKSKQILSQTEAPMTAAVEAFSDGVNQYIVANKKNLPPEFFILGYQPDPWEPYHCLNMAGYMAWDLSFSWSADVTMHKIKALVSAEKFKQLLPQLDIHNAPVFPDFTLPSVPDIQAPLSEAVITNVSEPFIIKNTLLTGAYSLPELVPAVFHGSNNWAVSGQKSISGKPLLANDMHLSLFAPGVWYQAHQVIAGKLNVTGVVLPGQPFVIAGHNERIAWGMTNLMVDNLDFYLETLNPQNHRQYKFNGQWKDMPEVKEIIKIKGGDTTEKTLRFTHRGPVISPFKKLTDRTISMRWVGNAGSNELRGMYRLNRARNWQEFRNSLADVTAVSQNVVYADVDGNIGMQTCAGIAIRKNPSEPVVPGDTDRFDWKGMVPFQHLPSSYNPSCGYVSSANNKTVTAHYPYYIGNWFATPARNSRIRDMLTAKEKLDIADFQLIQTDQRSNLVLTMLPDILKILAEQSNLTVYEKNCIKILSRWDGNVSNESAAPLIFEQIYLALAKQLVHDELGDELFEEYISFSLPVRNLLLNVWTNRTSLWLDDVTTKEIETFQNWVVIGFKEAASTLKNRIGGEPSALQWGRLHRWDLKHPLGRIALLDSVFNFNRGPFPVGGSFHTIRPFTYSFNKPYTSAFGASQRHIFSTADWDQSLTIIPTGISGIPASPHYCDQTELYVADKYRNDLFSKTTVTKNAVYKMKFPKK